MDYEAHSGEMCRHYIAGKCDLGLFNGKPESADCASCDRYTGPSRGLGDKIAKAAKLTGAATIVNLVSTITEKDCGCGKRRAKLNEAFPTRNDNGSDVHIDERPVHTDR